MATQHCRSACYPITKSPCKGYGVWERVRGRDATCRLTGTRRLACHAVLEQGAGQRRPYTKEACRWVPDIGPGPESLDASVWLFSCRGAAGLRPGTRRAPWKLTPSRPISYQPMPLAVALFQRRHLARFRINQCVDSPCRPDDIMIPSGLHGLVNRAPTPPNPYSFHYPYTIRLHCDTLPLIYSYCTTDTTRQRLFT